MIDELKLEFRKAANPEKAQSLSRFFKTGKGQYAEGDRFLGLTVPVTRALVKRSLKLPYGDIKKLLRSPWHEERLAALLLMAHRFRAGGEQEKERLYNTYLASTRFINNWDLVDISAGTIVGGWLADKSRQPLFKLARSKSLWERRIAMIACFHDIYSGKTDTAFKIARLLLADRHDLIHKAVGWMLREAGKRCSEKDLLDFLRKNYARMPRTTLRYAIERFQPKKRKELLAGKF